ncbi:MAG TPA: hypothetical protein PKE12_13685 [Kiritimatiellia bacterium]|nr:hypothetical protein [Kiritimatiellia bacterium]
MSRRRLFALGAAAWTAVSAAHAIDFSSAAEFHLQEDATLEHQLVINAAQVDLKGRVLDDVFLLAQRATLSGEADGAVWMLGGELHAPGRVNGHLRAIAQNLSISGRLDRDLSALASVMRVATNALVEGRLDAIAEQVSLEGRFGGRVRILARSATIGGTYAEDVRVIAEDIVVLPGTRIAGNLVYTSNKELFLDRSVLLGGELARSAREAPPARDLAAHLQGAALHGAKAMAALVAGLVFLALFPGYAGRATRHLQRSSFRCSLTGLAGLIFLPLAAILLMVTLVGLPLGLIVAAAWGSLLYLAKVIVALAVGSMLLRRSGPQRFPHVALALLTGLAALYTATFIPVIGGALSLVVGILGLGGLLLALNRGDEPRGPPALPPPAT